MQASTIEAIQTVVDTYGKQAQAASNLDQHTAELFAQTINKLKGKVTILFITHQLPKGLAVDEAILLGKDAADTATEDQVNANSEEKVET